jgi:hypothetical protein
MLTLLNTGEVCSSKKNATPLSQSVYPTQLHYLGECKAIIKSIHNTLELFALRRSIPCHHLTVFTLQEVLRSVHYLVEFHAPSSSVHSTQDLIVLPR